MKSQHPPGRQKHIQLEYFSLSGICYFTQLCGDMQVGKKIFLPTANDICRQKVKTGFFSFYIKRFYTKGVNYYVFSN